jgi:V8-like Glu-specific endopeptidase
MLRTSTIRTLLVAAAGLVLALAALSAASPASAANRQDDPCRTRTPTVLDKMPEWRCVGLAKFADPGAELKELEQTESASTRLDPRADYGMAVSPDGRLYMQVAPLPQRLLPDMRGFNPDGKEVDTERESFGYRLTPFTILGSDDREVRLSTTNYPWRVFGAIRGPGSTVSNCSGALVGPRHLLTAGHCINDGAGTWYPNRKVAPGQAGIDSAPNGLKSAAWYYSVVGWTQNKDKNYDYGMIILEDRNDTAHLGWLGWWSSNHSGGVWNFGYPIWSQSCAASPLPPQCNNYLYGDDGSITTVNSHMLGYNLDMTNGHSGSPVYKYNGGDRRVIAVNAYNAGNSGQNWGTRIRSAVSQNICNWIGTWPSAYNYHGCY